MAQGQDQPAGKLIDARDRFAAKRKPEIVPWSSVQVGGLSFTAQCSDPMHYFHTVPGQCVCGQQWWDGKGPVPGVA